MDNYFWIKWKEQVIGILMRVENEYYVRFQANHLIDRQKYENIIKQTSFQPNKLYKNNELFDYFQRRLRVGENEDVFDRIRKTGAKRPTDNIWLEEMNEKQIKKMENTIKKIIEKSKNGEEK